MKKERDFDWLVTISIIAQVALIVWIGTIIDLSEKTILLLILAAVYVVGRASLRGQAAGLGRIVDLLENIKERLHSDGRKE